MGTILGSKFQRSRFRVLPACGDAEGDQGFGFPPSPSGFGGQAEFYFQRSRKPKTVGRVKKETTQYRRAGLRAAGFVRL